MQPVDMGQSLFGFVEMSPWFIPHYEGYMQHKLMNQQQRIAAQEKAGIFRDYTNASK